MRWIVEASLRFRYLVVFLAGALMVFAIARLGNSAVDVFPEFAPPKVEIQTLSLGLSAEAVESLVTVPLEHALNGLPGLDVMRSRSVPDLSDIILIFKPGTDLILARQLVQERVAAVTPSLPTWAAPPVMIQPLSSTSRALKIGISSDQYDLMDLSMIAYWKIRARLLDVPGVANAPIWGERIKMPQVQVDPERMIAHEVSFNEVMEVTADALDVGLLMFSEGSVIGTGGFIDTPNQRLGIRSVLPVLTPETLAQVPISDRTKADGTPLLLGDVGDVVWGTWPLFGDAVINEGPGLMMIVEKLPWAREDDERRLNRPIRLSTGDLPSVFSFVFGSCNVSSRVPYQNTALAPAAATNPDFVVHLGDFGYADTGAYQPSKAGHLAFWSDLPYEENLRSLFQKPWIFVASDHDLGGNNVDSTTLSSSALEAYSEWQNNDPAEDGIGRYGRVEIDQGKVAFIWIDAISQRSPIEMPDGPTKTALGADQKKWLLDLISSSPASLLVIASQGAIGHADETAWHSYQSELAEILEPLIAREGHTRWLSGDHHSARYARFSSNMAEWGAAPFAEIAQGDPGPSTFTQSSVTVTRRTLRDEGEGVAIRKLVLEEMSEDEINAFTSFGRVEIDTAKKSATFQILDANGRIRVDPNGEQMQETLVYS